MEMVSTNSGGDILVAGLIDAEPASRDALPEAPTASMSPGVDKTIENSNTSTPAGKINFGKALRRVWGDMLKHPPSPLEHEYLKAELPINKLRLMIKKISTGVDLEVLAVENVVSVDLIVRRAGLIRFEAKS